jgi:hypothetical protein
VERLLPWLAIVACAPSSPPPAPRPPVVTSTPRRQLDVPPLNLHPGLRDQAPIPRIMVGPPDAELAPPFATGTGAAEVAKLRAELVQLRGQIKDSYLRHEPAERRAPLEHRATEARDRLLASLEGATRTEAGDYLRGELLYEIADERFDAAVELGSPPDAPDYKDAIAAFEAYVAKFPAGPRRLLARYELVNMHDDYAPLVAARAFADLARDAGDTRLGLACQAHAAEEFFFAGDYQDAAPAYAYVADHTTDPPLVRAALEGLARSYGRLDKHDQQRDALCRVTPDDVNALDLAATFWNGDTATLRDACAAHRCPCRADVLAQAADGALERDDDPTARDLLDFALTQFPTDALACKRAQLAAREEDEATAVSLAKRSHDCIADLPISLSRERSDLAGWHLQHARGVRRCFEDLRILSPGTLSVTIDIGARGTAAHARVEDKVFGPDLDACVTAALDRHRWFGLHDVVIAVPIRFSIGD